MTALLLLTVLGHIKLTEPPSFQLTDANGNPNKQAPCGGNGTATNAVTTVEAGSQLTVSWTEPIPHPGHFRIGIATDPADFVTPPVDAGTTACGSTTIETSPSYPTLVDGLFPHSSSTPGMTWTTTVTVPMISCDHCTLQLMQFMGSHGAPCFYYQCAVLKIVMPDAGAPMVDAGTPVDAGAPDAGRIEDAGLPVDVDAGMMSGDAGVAITLPGPATGCASVVGLAPLLLSLLALRRRR